MFRSFRSGLIDWVTREPPPEGFPMCDFDRIRYEVRPCDVLLIEGRSRVSNVIKQITQSSWSHACLYVGRIHDVDDEDLRKVLTEHFNGSLNEQLIIEGFMGKGTIVSPLSTYRTDHIRICRPRGLARKDAQNVIAYAIDQLGTEYNVRQIVDLARFLVPWSFVPGRWRSTLFSKHAGPSTKTVCSTMIAEAFASVEFPILPLIKKHEETGIELIPRNPKLYTPRDFDYSPFFEIIKYPFIELSELTPYRNLPWNRSGAISPDGLTVVQSMAAPEQEQESKLALNQVLNQEPTSETTHDSSQTTMPISETAIAPDLDNNLSATNTMTDKAVSLADESSTVRERIKRKASKKFKQWR